MFASRNLKATRGNEGFFRSIKALLNVGIGVLLLFFGVFGFWATFANLDAAVISPGQVVFVSDTHIVQHLEGGIVKEVLVEEGSYVQANQPILHLEDIRAQSQIKTLQSKMFTLKLIERRLIAERDRVDFLSEDDEDDLYDSNCVDRLDQDFIYKALDSQERLFDSRKLNILGKISILENQIEQKQYEVDAINAQLDATHQQIDIIAEELQAKNELLKREIIDKNSVQNIRKQKIALSGKIGEYLANIAQVNQRISETELEIVSLQDNFYSEVLKDLEKVESEIIDVESRLISLADVLDRIIVRAPQEGVINKLYYQTVGRVISSGAPIAEISPVHDHLLVNIAISPQDIEPILLAFSDSEKFDEIEGVQGIKANIRLTAFSNRKLGLFPGILYQISADLVKDAYNREHYSGKVLIPSSESELLKNKNIKLYPGMPVIVYVLTESRNFLSYLLHPILGVIDDGLKESNL